MRVRRFWQLSLIVGTAGVSMLVGCGGGGGGSSAPPSGGGIPTIQPATVPPATSSPVPTSTATVVPTGSALPAGCSVRSAFDSKVPCSTYSISSNPSGLTVVLNNQIAGTTPTSLVPSPSNTASTLIIRGGPSDYVVSFAQLRNGNQNVFYNRSTDTSGSIASGYQSEVRRPTEVVTAREGAPRRMPATALRASIDQRHLYVRYRASALSFGGRNAVDIERAENLAGDDVGPEIAGVRTRVIGIPSNSNYDRTASQLTRHAEVASVSRVHMRYPTAVAVTPNDPHFALTEQWDMRQIGMPAAWGYTLGQNATIAVLDSGYDTPSKDFAKVTVAQTFLNGAAGVSGAQDLDGHGSNTAGIAAASTNNGFGYAGTGYNANLQIYRIIDANGGISTADEANALYAAVKNGAKVISLSIGGLQFDPSSGTSGYDDVEAAAIANAIVNNVTVVAAAGNESPYTPYRQPTCDGTPSCGTATLDFPAAYPGVIAVGASAINDSGPTMREYVASYSNGGPGLGIVAPGGDPTGSSDNNNFHWITNLSTTTPSNAAFKCSQGPPDGACAALFAGTSQATPHVAGAAALLLSVNPSLTPAQVATLLYSTADDLGVETAYQGRGRLNVARALAKLTGDTSFPTYRPAPAQFIAFAYTNSGAQNAAPTIVDITYPTGVPVALNGTFRIADVNTNTPYKIGVWYNAAGNGRVTAGDYFGSTGTCPTTVPCQATNITVSKLTSSAIP